MTHFAFLLGIHALRFAGRGSWDRLYRALKEFRSYAGCGGRFVASRSSISECTDASGLRSVRDKVVLRCSGAHQTGGDVVVSALLGGDSFEFGTTALMMLKCVMAKNCNIKCPAGLTTNPEVFDGDPRSTSLI